MDGAELAARLHARRKTLKMIAISGYAGNAEHALTDDFLAKPFSRDQLLEKVREVLDRR
jgi:CheY-like chemotaxis protein